MKLAGVVITCIKALCGRQEQLDVAGVRDDGGLPRPINSQRPAGWIAGPVDPGDVLRGLCPEHASEFQAAVQEYLNKDVPSIIPPPRKYEIQAAKCDPVQNTILDHIEESAHAPQQAKPAAPALSAIPMQAEVMRPQIIQPQVQVARGGFGASYPAPLPSKPIMPVFRSNGTHSTPPAAAMTPAAPNMSGVQVQIKGLPNRIDCSPSGEGIMRPVAHDFAAGAPQAAGIGVSTATFQPASNVLPAQGGGDSVEMSYSPFAPAEVKAPPV